MTIALTGHRPHKLGNEYDLKGPYSNYLRHELQIIIDIHKPTKAISGMALGADTIWALLALQNNIPLTAAIPCNNQENKWKMSSKKLYHNILSNQLTTKVVINTGPYQPWKMNQRNIWMVDHCDLLIAIYNGSEGGTKNCYEYAKQTQKATIKINPDNAIPKH